MRDLERFVDIERYRKMWSGQFNLWPPEFDKTLHWRIFMLLIANPDQYFTKEEMIARLEVPAERGVPQINHLSRIIMSDPHIEVVFVGGSPERRNSYKLHTGLFRYRRRKSKN